MKNLESVNRLREYISEPNSFWVGENPVINVERFSNLTNSSLRFSPSLHGKYNTVWLIEDMVSNYSYWKIIIDESIRLIKDQGKLIVRFSQNDNLNIIEIKQFFGRSILINQLQILEEYIDKDGLITIVFGFNRVFKESYKSKSWSFVLLTQGKKVENVLNFLNSVKKQKQLDEYEIIISGPKNDKYIDHNIRYLEVECDEKRAPIAYKKNKLIEQCNYENIIILHDRYILGDDFLQGFENYGYDYDFITVSQKYEDNSIYPSYAKLSKKMKWSKLYFTEDEKLFDDNFFLNGGLLIFKKALISEVKFNSLLYWNQAEDVELSCEMLLNSVVPRINLCSSAITIGIGREYTKTFNHLKSTKRINRHIRLRQFIIDRLPIKVKKVLKEIVYGQ